MLEGAEKIHLGVANYRQFDGETDERMDGEMEERMQGPMDRQMDGWIDL